MKKTLLSHLIFLMAFFTANAQSFFKSYDVEWASYGGIISTKDGGYLRAASIFYESRAHILLVKTNASGNIQWSKTWGQIDGTQVSNIIQTTEGGYAIAASSTVGSKTGMILIKLNISGNTEWVKHYTSNLEMRGVESLIQTPDGGYVFAGERIQQVLLNERKRACLVKTDSLGNLVWSKLIFKLKTYASIDKLALTKDGGFIMVGSFSPSNENTSSSCLIKVKADGTLEWIRATPGSNFDQLLFVKVLKDNGYLLGGYVFTENMRSDMFLTKVNAAGVSLWSKLIASQVTTSREQFYDAIELPDGYGAIGYTDSSGEYSPVFARFGKNGKLMESVILNTPYRTYARFVTEYTNTGFAITLQEYVNADKMYIAKFDRFGKFCNPLANFGVGRDTAVIFQNTSAPFDNFSNLQVTASAEETVPLALTVTDLCNKDNFSGNENAQQNLQAKNFENAGINLSPNPVMNILHLKWAALHPGNATIEIYSAGGNKIYETKVYSSKGENAININTNRFAKGLYLLKLRSVDNVKIIKFVKE